MKDFLSASTVVVRRRGETVIESRLATNRHPVVLPAPTGPGRFEIREAVVGDDKRFTIVWAPLTLIGASEVKPLLPLLEFNDADDARDALARIEKAFTRPVWRKAVRVYQVLGFVVAVLGTLAFWNTLVVPHGNAPMAAGAPVSADVAGVPASGGANSAVDPAIVNALLARQRATLQNQIEGQLRPGAAPAPAPAAPAPEAPAPSSSDAGSPGDAVANALSGKK